MTDLAEQAREAENFLRARNAVFLTELARHDAIRLKTDQAVTRALAALRQAAMDARGQLLRDLLDAESSLREAGYDADGYELWKDAENDPRLRAARATLGNPGFEARFREIDRQIRDRS